MLKNLLASLLFFLTITASSIAAAQSPLSAGNRLFFTQEAHNLRPGLFSITFSGSGFTKSGDYLNPQKGGQAEDLKIYNSDLTFDYGISKHFSLSVGTTILESAFPNEGSGIDNDFLNEVRLSGKFGSIELFTENLELGILTTIFLPLQPELNAPFFPLRSGSLDLQTMAIFSYYFDNLLKEESGGLHVNIGPKFYLTTDADFARLPNQTAEVSEAQLGFEYAVGANIPFASFELFVEYYGSTFLDNKLPDFTYSRESYAYAGGGLNWQTFDWLQLSVMYHMLVSGGDSDDETAYNPTIGVFKLSDSDINYSPYMVSAGLTFTFGTSFDLYKSDSFEEEPTEISDDAAARYAEIENIIGENSRELVDIYFKGRKIDNKLQGSVYFSITIARDGSTKDARILVSTFHETNIARMVENDMLETVRTWRYPEGEQELQIEILKMNFSSESTRFITN